MVYIVSIYGRKLLSKSVDDKITKHSETMDAILWDVDTATKLCRVRIQGSSDYITVHYPENWRQTPEWLKPGNSVRISFKSGLRGLPEIVGSGFTVPTTVGGGTTPVIATATDTVLTGSSILQQQTNTSMTVTITAGTYRIGGTTYPLVSQDILIDPAPSAGNFRYDIFVVGVDGTVDYVNGSASTTPVMPTTPANHVLLGWVLVPSGATSITQNMINMLYTIPVATRVTMAIDDNELSWGDNWTNITTTVKDQYNNSIVTTGLGWNITFEIVNGNGSLTSVEEGPLTLVHQHSGTSASSTVTYTRLGTTGELSPMIETILVDNGAAEIGFITLLDSDGDTAPPSTPPTFSDVQYLLGGEQTVTYSSDITIDFENYGTGYLELTGDCAITVTNTINGGVYRLNVVQKNGGSHGITWNNVDYWQGAVLPTLSTAEDSWDNVTFHMSHSKIIASLTANFGAA